jgi:hypothetical protein
MKIGCKRILTVFLCAAVLCGGVAFPARAADGEERPSAFMQFLYDVGDAAIRAVGWAIGSLIYTDLPREFVYEDEGFYKGMDGPFLDKPAQGARWSLGYASKTLLYAGLFDPVTKEYIGPSTVFMGGGLVGDGQSFGELKTPTKLLDDQRVRVTALSDGSGRGTAVFASVDGYALTSYDLRIIRNLLRDFAEEKNVVSINIGVLHQHSCIDILGMNGSLLGALFFNPGVNLLNGILQEEKLNPYSGRSRIFMEKLRRTTVRAIQEAVNGMEEGTLYYGEADAEKYVHDKRAPKVMDTKLRRFRFDPDKAGAKETWLVNFAAHAVGLGASTRQLSSDYPHFMDMQAQEKYGVNFQMIQGAQLAITTNYNDLAEGYTTGYERMQAYGRGLADILAAIQDKEVAPLLNLRSREFSVRVDNPLHMVLFRLGMLKSTGFQSSFFSPELDLVTETGYMELGEDLAVAFAPGEIDPILAYGGALKAAEAWTGEDFPFTPMRDMVRGKRELMVFGILNDHSGYYLVPNDIHSFVLFGNEEVNTASTKAAPALLEAFKAVTDSVK